MCFNLMFKANWAHRQYSGKLGPALLGVKFVVSLANRAPANWAPGKLGPGKLGPSKLANVCAKNAWAQFAGAQTE